MTDKWYTDSKLVAALGEALTNADVLTEQTDFTNYLKKPMAYNDHYDAWAEAGYPTSEDDNGWDEFVEAVNSDEEGDEDDDNDDESDES